MPKRKANGKLPARFGKNWTFHEQLDVYNIRFITVDTNAFFGISDLPTPDPVVSPVILNHASPPADLDSLPYADSSFFRHLNAPDFMSYLLGPILQIEARGRMGLLNPIPKLQFFMSGTRVYATPRATLQDKEKYYVLLVEVETTPGDREEPRLVASALAAFTADNRKRANAGLSPLPSKRYIGIGMVRSAPRLYKITITQDLLNAVATSQPLAEETIIERFVPPVPDMDSFFDKGMEPLENRYICLQCFEALKALL